MAVVEAWANCSTLMPGRRILLWYDDDEVWPERVLPWSTSPAMTSWWVYNLDGDVYPGIFNGTDDCTSFRFLKPGGAMVDRSALRASVYSFREILCMPVLLEGILKAREEVMKENGDDGQDSVSLGLVTFSTFEKWRGEQPSLGIVAAAPPTPRDASGGPQQQQQQQQRADSPADAYVLKEPLAGYRVEQVIPRPRHYVTRGTHALCENRDAGGVMQSAVLVKFSGAESFFGAKRIADFTEYLKELGEAASTESPTAGGPTAAAGTTGDGSAGDDMHTLPVAHDKHGDRERVFSDGVFGCKEDVCADWPLDKPRTGFVVFQDDC